jgi:pilus assembly protein CpaE
MPEPKSAARKIRLLVVDDIPETRDNVKKLLYFEDDIEILGTAANGREGIEMALRLEPDIVLMDINMPGMDGIAASEAISTQLPNVQVVMMSVQGEADYLRRSMLAGAREFLIKPFSGEELVTSIHRVHQLGAARRLAAAPPVVIAPEAPPPKGARMIVVLGTKGGAGSTTIAANLAVALRDESKERVALVDANFEFGDIGVLLNLPTNRTIADLVGDDVDIDEELLNGVMANHPSGIRVLLAPARPEMAELITPDLLKRAMPIVRGMFDFIIIDLWKSFQESMIYLLDSADQILLVSTSDIPSIKNTKLFFELADQLGYPSRKTIFVLNKDDGRSGVNVKDIQATIKHPVRAVINKDERTTLLALNRGTPFVNTQRSLPISHSIASLARIVIQSRDQETPPEKLTAVPAKARR